jgi:hypothetical protein
VKFATPVGGTFKDVGWSESEKSPIRRVCVVLNVVKPLLAVTVNGYAPGSILALVVIVNELPAVRPGPTRKLEGEKLVHVAPDGSPLQLI